ncbi:DUF1127 domain-containing protein [Pelagibius sp. 7325]|uniref:DUF1127 domain-containing protein n=1 Tax=Pelagibius sp. 7325 TaxID=3131994 RepID=UPI0030EB2AD0
MSDSNVFGSPMILTGTRPASPFGAASYAISSETPVAKTGRRLLKALQTLFAVSARDRRIHQTVEALSQLDDRTLRDIGLNRAAIISAAQQSARDSLDAGHRRAGRYRM